ncbi:MAG: HPF/RaiA family ribosome-associated protein [Myxococcota bacterium]
MASNASIVVHFKDLEVDEEIRAAIERRCDVLSGEFREVERIELTLFEQGTGFEAHGHVLGKNTNVATQAHAEAARPASDQVLNRIERQLRKEHDKRIFSRRRGARKDPWKRREA